MMKHITLVLLIGLILVTGVRADQEMAASEILQLFDRLCEHPTSGWIRQGRIEAIHRCSDVLSNQVTETVETVTTDGNRFSWNIRTVLENGDKRQTKQNTDNYLRWNQDRTFIWDGQTYTLYFKPRNRAIVYENPSIPVNVNGPLTAGYIPWGHGIFTFENLSESQFSASNVQTKLGSHIQLSVKRAENMEMHFVLDPAQNNAVVSYTLLKGDNFKVVQTYGNFIEQQGRYIPMNILIDRYEDDQLHSSDSWEIISLQDTLPQENFFVASFQEKALVEYHSPGLEKSMFYRHSNRRNINPLLEKRFINTLKKDLRKQNCGTVATEKVLSELGVAATDSELESLIDDISGDTSLYQIQQLVQQKGQFCLPVKTTLSGLGRFKDSQVILHFPKKKHFVVLDRVDQKDAWIIDLDRQTFYHSMDIFRLEQEWAAGIALIISDEPLSLGKGDRPVPELILKNITGSADYLCSELIQWDHVDLCPEMIQGICDGRYTVWEERYGCQPVDKDGGYCDGTGVIGSIYSSCTEDLADPGQCTTTGNYVGQNIRACLP